MNVNFTFIFQDPNIIKNNPNLKKSGYNAPQTIWTFTILDESKEPYKVTMENFRDAISYAGKRQKMRDIGQLVAEMMGYGFVGIGYSVKAAEGIESDAEKYPGLVFRDFDDFENNGFKKINEALSKMLPNINEAPEYYNL